MQLTPQTPMFHAAPQGQPRMPTEEELTRLVLEKGFYLDQAMRLVYVFDNDVEQIPDPQTGQTVRMPSRARIYRFIVVSSGEMGAVGNMQLFDPSSGFSLSPLGEEASQEVVGPVARMIRVNLQRAKSQIEVLEKVLAGMEKQRGSYVAKEE